jgi:hypothetical protein
MIRRVHALMLALLVASAPAALTACELMCAAADAGREAPTDSCHSHQSRAPISIASGGHVCGHGDALPVAPGKMTAHGASGPATAVTSRLSLFDFDAAGIQHRSPRVAASPPGPPTAATHLRI